MPFLLHRDNFLKKEVVEHNSKCTLDPITDPLDAWILELFPCLSIGIIRIANTFHRRTG